MWPSFTSIQAYVDVKPTTWSKQQQHTQIHPQSWVPSVITSAAVTAAARSSMDPRRPRTQATFSGPVFHTYILWATISQHQINMAGAWASIIIASTIPVLLNHNLRYTTSGAVVRRCQRPSLRKGVYLAAATARQGLVLLIIFTR